MKRVRLAALCAALGLALSLAACGGGDGGSSSSALTLAEGPNPVVNGSGASSALGDQETQEAERHMMTVDETLVFFSKLTPQDLELEGESMEEYNFYPSEKAIPVYGLPSMKVIVYRQTEASTNEPVGTFLVARDGMAVYRLEEGDVTKVWEPPM